MIFDIMGFFHCLKVFIYMKTTIEQLDFPCEIQKKLKMKVSTTNLEIKFLPGHMIKFNQTNLSVREPHRIIASSSKGTLIALLYDNNKKTI